MSLDVVVHDEFENLLTTMQQHAQIAGLSHKNQAQPAWLRLSEKTGSRAELLAGLSRQAINAHHQAAWAKAAETEERVILADAIQNDFVAAVARDLFHLRRSRLGRCFARVAAAEHLGSAENSPFIRTLRTFVQNLQDRPTVV